MDYTLDYAFELGKLCKLKERENRLYDLWVLYYTNAFISGKRKEWETFYKESTQTTKATPNTPDGKYGKITGVDLAQM